MGKIDRWGIDIFRLNAVTTGRPLTAVAYTIFQVNFSVAFIFLKQFVIAIVAGRRVTATLITRSM